VSSENIELVRHWFEAWNTGEPVLDAVAADAELVTAAGVMEGGPFTGRDQIRGFLDGVREGWKPGSDMLVVREIEEAGDRVLASFEWRAIGDASGIEVSSNWTMVSTFRGDQIVRLQFFSDRDAAITAAG
jgi:ketosteroid isomerase-like protein